MVQGPEPRAFKRGLILLRNRSLETVGEDDLVRTDAVVSALRVVFASAAETISTPIGTAKSRTTSSPVRLSRLCTINFTMICGPLRHYRVRVWQSCSLVLFLKPPYGIFQCLNAISLLHNDMQNVFQRAIPHLLGIDRFLRGHGAAEEINTQAVLDFFE